MYAAGFLFDFDLLMQILMMSLEQFYTFWLDCSSKQCFRIKCLENIKSIYVQ